MSKISEKKMKNQWKIVTTQRPINLIYNKSFSWYNKKICIRCRGILALSYEWRWKITTNYTANRNCWVGYKFLRLYLHFHAEMGLICWGFIFTKNHEKSNYNLQILIIFLINLYCMYISKQTNKILLFVLYHSEFKNK